MSTSGARREILRPDRAHLFQLRRITPDIDEFLTSQIAGWQRKLHTRKHISVRRNVAGCVPTTERKPLHHTLPRGWGGEKNFLNITNKSGVVKNLLEFGS